MSEPKDDPSKLVENALAGDLHAIVDLVQKCERPLRRMVRVQQMTRIQNVYDSGDVYNSVMGDFVRKYQDGEYQFQSTQQLFRLLSKLMIHKLIDKIRLETAEKRCGNRTLTDESVLDRLPNDDHTPSRIAEARELFEEIVRRLSPDEYRIAMQRYEGQTWDAIGEQSQESGEALRKRLTRGLQRVAKDLKLDAEDTPVL
mgnify:CR=1 FL=1